MDYLGQQTKLSRLAKMWNDEDTVSWMKGKKERLLTTRDF